MKAIPARHEPHPESTEAEHEAIWIDFATDDSHVRPQWTGQNRAFGDTSGPAISTPQRIAPDLTGLDTEYKRLAAMLCGRWNLKQCHDHQRAAAPLPEPATSKQLRC